MKNAALFYVLVIIATLPNEASAINKCVTKEGVVYQDRPCLAGEQTVVEIVVRAFGKSRPRPVSAWRTTADASVKDSVLVAVPVSVVAAPPPKQ